MNEDTTIKMSRMRTARWSARVALHTVGGAVFSCLLALVVLPARAWSNIVSLARESDASIFVACGFHLLIGYAFWLFFVFTIHALRSPRRPKLLSRGSSLVETLVVMPVFLLLAFGMAQLSINNAAGILANVAVYQAGRAAWIWMPEEQAADKRMQIKEGIAEQKARVAAAMVMLPIAPGDYFFGTLDSDVAQNARIAAVGAHGVPNLGAGIGVASQGTNALDGKTFYHALGSQSFVERTMSKFSMAHNATEIAIDEETHEVTLTYSHFQGMPLVGRVFGTYKRFGGATLRPGYYSEIVRTYGFEKQANVPNARRPNNLVFTRPHYTDYTPGFEL